MILECNSKVCCAAKKVNKRQTAKARYAKVRILHGSLGPGKRGKRTDAFLFCMYLSASSHPTKQKILPAGIPL